VRPSSSPRRIAVWLAIPEPTEWQRIGDQIDTAFIFARAEFVFMHRVLKPHWLSIAKAF
jgi:hypothetical protein